VYLSSCALLVIQVLERMKSRVIQLQKLGKVLVVSISGHRNNVLCHKEDGCVVALYDIGNVNLSFFNTLSLILSMTTYLLKVLREEIVCRVFAKKKCRIKSGKI